MDLTVTEVRSRGVITIPKTVRDANNIQDGQQYVVHDLGQGTLLLSPRKPQVDTLCNDLRDELLARGASLEGMLEELRQIRETEGA